MLARELDRMVRTTSTASRPHAILTHRDLQRTWIHTNKGIRAMSEHERIPVLNGLFIAYLAPRMSIGTSRHPRLMKKDHLRGHTETPPHTSTTGPFGRPSTQLYVSDSSRDTPQNRRQSTQRERLEHLGGQPR